MVSTLMLSELYSKLATPVRSTETLDQYFAAPKPTRDKLKDVGGFIGGKMFNGIRKAGYVEYRDLITLDLDSIPAGQTKFVCDKILSLGISVCIYSTRKHRPEAPRLRAVFPINRSVTADEYEPIARKLAQFVCTDMSWLDRTTFDVSRIMYWPSVSSDSQYVYKWSDNPFIDADGFLRLYQDWRNFNEWPKCPTEDMTHAPATKQENPLEKKGAVGAFCRTYSIRQAMDKFLPGVYIPAGDDRYTYANGSTTGGAIIYDNKYLYSHHATDPACNTLCNAFDLVRIHLFGKLDDSAKEGTPTHKLPSFTKMRDMAINDPDVALLIKKERAAEAYSDFAGVGNDPENPASPDSAAVKEKVEEASSWMLMLKDDGNNGYVKSYENVLIALENDPQLKGRFFMNTFTKRPMAIAPLPWGNRVNETNSFEWTDPDDDGLTVYMEKRLGIRTKSLIISAHNECWARHQFHPVIDYLSKLVWDGIPRLEFVFQTYLGAEDNVYVRAVAKMTFVAAITRIFAPGTKFDTAVVFVGPQGLGKTSFITAMAKYNEWYTDNLQKLDRTAVENIQGVWLADFGELSALKKNELEDIKSFMTRQADRTRLAYGKYAVTLPRTCVFFGTTNTHNFLKDPTGERRFLPIDCAVAPIAKSTIYDLPNEVDQIWAEALYYYNLQTTPLILPKEIADYAKIVQEEHHVRSENQGLIEDFLEKLIPADWDSYSLDQRLLFYADTATQRNDLVPRTKVCAMEIYCECLGGKKEQYKSSNGWEINNILRRIPGWHTVNKPRRYSIYGLQRGFEKDGTEGS